MLGVRSIRDTISLYMLTAHSRTCSPSLDTADVIPKSDILGVSFESTRTCLHQSVNLYTPKMSIKGLPNIHIHHAKHTHAHTYARTHVHTMVLTFAAFRSLWMSGGFARCTYCVRANSAASLWWVYSANCCYLRVYMCVCMYVCMYVCMQSMRIQRRRCQVYSLCDTPNGWPNCDTCMCQEWWCMYVLSCALITAAREIRLLQPAN
jgi:hypothetical protein